MAGEPQLTGATNGAGFIKDTTTAAFRADVIAESARQPVLVEFWGPTNAASKQLAPVLDRVVKAAGGKVKLVRMNVEAQPEIARQLGVQSLPSVYAFQRGQPADGFVGALPEAQVKGFIERLVGPLGDAVTEALAEAAAALDAGDSAAAAEAFARALVEDEANVKALAGLAKLYVAAGELEEARGLLELTPKGKETDAGIAAARAALDLAEQAGSLGDLRRFDDSDSRDHRQDQLGGDCVARRLPVAATRGVTSHTPCVNMARCRTNERFPLQQSR